MSQRPAIHLIHGPNSPLLETLKTCTRLAASDATVLLTGETGTGKEVFARYTHERSGRAGRPFVPVNCGAIPETLLESELFGYVKGAFTGASTSRKGRIAHAEGGTLFLDEIGELPLSMQVKLLRVLQERSYEPVGASEPVSANFRLIAATNRDLAAEVAAGRFRRDLYYRLMVCPLELPALRERRGDIAPLFLHFWSARGEQRPLEPEVMQHLERYDWPGNVRELENLVERVSVCAEGPSIRVQDLPTPVRPAAAPALRAVPVAVPAEPVLPLFAGEAPAANAAPAVPAATPAEPAPAALPAPSLAASPSESLASSVLQVAQALASSPIDMQLLLRQVEDTLINAALERAAGNKKAAADLLGLQRTTLVEKLRRRERFGAQTAA